jgi:hypothetical protein
MNGTDREKDRDPPQGEDAIKTDGSLGDARIKPLKQPVNADAFLVDRPLSPEEEGLAGPLPERSGDEDGESGL